MDIQIFVGVDCDEQQLTMGFVGSQGILRSLSRTSSPLPDHLDTFGQRLHGMIRGLRGEENLRMKNFRAIGIGVPGRYIPDVRKNVEDQMKRLMEIHVYIEDREVLAAKGAVWLKEVADMMRPGQHSKDRDLNVVYGAAKLAIDSTRPKNGIVKRETGGT